MFNVVWFLKLRLNDTFFIHLKKIANAHTTYHDVKTEFFGKKSRKVKKKIMCAFNKQRQNHVVIIFYHIYL